jgi:hypothetical protein
MANKRSQTSARAVGLTMDARSSDPGLDTPQTRQPFAPGRTSAPQRLQAKAKAGSSLEVRVITENICRRFNSGAMELNVAGSRRRVATNLGTRQLAPSIHQGG